ncbi:MAG: zinc ribbon domain-containing protein [Clostridia bacterium]|nr:zinc ribbon domain-containing protein [Clostridia bacterium]
MSQCIYCKQELPEGSAFCPSCGKKQVIAYKQTFQRDGMSEKEFIEKINLWFQSYPQVANVKASFELKLRFGLLVNKYKLNSVTIEYEQFSGQNENQYAVEKLSRLALVKLSLDHLLARWQKSNPGATVVSRNGGVNQRGQIGSLLLFGIGAFNRSQLYLLYKFNRKKGPLVP